MTYFDGFVVTARRRGLGDSIQPIGVYTFVRAVAVKRAKLPAKRIATRSC